MYTTFKASCPLSLFVINKHSTTNKTTTHRPIAPTINNHNTAHHHHHHHRAHPLHPAYDSYALRDGPLLFRGVVRVVCAGAESWDAVTPAQPVPVSVHGHSPSSIAPKTATSAAPRDTSFSSQEARPQDIEAQHPQHGDEGGARIHARSQMLCVHAHAAGGKGSFEIYVNPTHVTKISARLLVKKRLRVALDEVGWSAGGARTMEEVTNVMREKGGGLKEGLGQAKETTDENEKEKLWTTIGQGRKDSKEKQNKIRHKPIEYILDAHPRLKTPDSQSRMWPNYLDSVILLKPMSTAPASAFTSSFAFTSSNSNTYLFNSSSSATATVA
ncbi:LOW QUALITY PROTEIN: hypothetical protein CVT25_003353 [Psilocybe cyanescens]|uniref:Uncharacterized protein n=1 Tax=Psilocybe cyanescens TaxID=93625 RepID=A0A409XQW9_PSICY|nr:LOW QUALITY PROTEIN: hypothetical protein CVT25_003353 [Psilocybe cyanescens]